MKYESKILGGFMTVAAVSVAVGAIASYALLSRRTEKDFVFQSQSKIQLVAKSLHAFEQQVDMVAQNASKALSEIERSRGLPSDVELATIARNLSVSNIFVTDAKGRFIRSTNGRIEDFKNGLFDYCAGYRGLVDGSSPIEQTPIIPSSDEATPGPFKYTMYPNHDRTRVLEVSVHLDYIVKTLSDFIHSDPGIRSVGLFTPTGESLGTLRALKDATAVDGAKYSQEELLNRTVRHENGHYIFNETVQASIPQCCECKTKGVVRPGEDYFYTLRAEISDEALVQAKSELLWLIAGTGFLVLLIAYCLARRLSASLAKRIRLIESGISRILETKQLSQRLNVIGSDELSRMGQHFDQLLGTLEKAQHELLAAKGSEVTYRVAQDVAHNIKGPIAALEALLQMSPELVDHRRKVIQDCVKDIKSISSQLLAPKEEPKEISESEDGLVDIVGAAVTQKRLQYGTSPGLRFIVSNRRKLQASAPNSSVHELRTVVSNLIDNAVQATTDQSSPKVIVEVDADERGISIAVHDNGPGFSEDILKNVGKRGLTSRGNSGGHGIGLAHAFETAEKSGDTLEVTTSNALSGACVRYIVRKKA